MSGRPVGTRVTCHCGETFGFPRPPATPLSLQCPGCGAGADPGDQRCQYCDVPLRNVCCPGCFSLMFDGDRHCARCGTSVAKPALAVHRNGQATLPCPRCSVALTANLVADQLFDRCDRCGGIWAHHVAIDGLVSRKKNKKAVREWLATLPDATRHRDGDGPGRCPDCEEPMALHRVPGHRRVHIDACGTHGIWFDHSEIRTLVGENRSRRRKSRQRKYHRVRQRSQFASFLQDADDWWPWEALEDLLEFLEDLFD